MPEREFSVELSIVYSGIEHTVDHCAFCRFLMADRIPIITARPSATAIEWVWPVEYVVVE